MKRRTKVLRIITRLNIGGPSFHTILLTAHLDPKLFRCKLVKGREDELEGEMTDLLTRKGVTPIFIPEMRREFSLKDDLTAFWRLFRLMREEKPDIVHTHMAKAGAFGRLAARLAGVPVILHTFHGHIFNGYFGQLKTKTFILAERVLAHLSTRVVTVSERVRKEIVEKYGVCAYSKIITIPLGLELAPFLQANQQRGFLRKELRLPDVVPLIGIVARLAPVKGHQYFIQAAEKILKKHPRAKFLIVGDGELRGELEAQARKRGIEESCVFCGFRNDLAKVYADLDVVVLTSLNEGLPVALIEGMTAGKPVVVFDVGGVEDLIEDYVTGILVPFGDVQKLADSVTHLLDNPQEGERLGRNARRKAYPNLDYPRLVRDIEEFYCQLVRNGVN